MKTSLYFSFFLHSKKTKKKLSFHLKTSSSSSLGVGLRAACFLLACCALTRPAYFPAFWRLSAERTWEFLEC